ncbi:GNAT family N-acetyltransferase [Filomicrobium sp.]|uniref:GNAT family N-acetyltransferase n=1 Tax=Filomicrobium sp. TaxID=2024831 RepID=UPI002584DEFD|nr:GNAT family N-acetyltransferase [Filomicrobium sp.]MCV0368538.1 GNAT family N-acetyltransferase [Filomicrobium sp.]
MNGKPPHAKDQLLLIRRCQEKDLGATAQIFFDAVHFGTRDHYNDAQRQAWAPTVPEPSGWHQRLTSQTTLVAEQEDQIVGFMSLSREGCIDLAFVTPDRMGSGITSKLYEAILIEAADHGLTKLWTEASYLARSFFLRQGWQVIEPQTVTRNGIALTNFVMEKDLR